VDPRQKVSCGEAVVAIPDQRGKPTKNPTIRRVFQVFEGVTALYKGSKIVMVIILSHLLLLNIDLDCFFLLSAVSYL